MNTPDPNADQPPMSLKAAYVMLWRNKTKIVGYAMAVAGAAVALGHAPAWIGDYILILGGGSVAGIGHANSAAMRRAQDFFPQQKAQP